MDSFKHTFLGLTAALFAFETAGLSQTPYTVKVAVGRDRSCAISNDGQLKCWGTGSIGSLGIPGREKIGETPLEMGNALPRIEVGKNFSVKDICLTQTHTCALSAQGTVKCWGFNAYGQLGQARDTGVVGFEENDMGENLPITNLGSGFVASSIACGYNHSCAVSTRGEGKCWGSNQYGESGLDPKATKMVGRGATDMGDKLLKLPIDQPIKKLVAGYGYTCAMLDDRVLCWGHNLYGVLGLESPEEYVLLSAKSTVKLENPNVKLKMIDLEGGMDTVCAQYSLSSNKIKVKCWGENNSGALGAGLEIGAVGRKIGTMGANLPEVNVAMNDGFELIVHNLFSCVRSKDKNLKCWGANYLGQLGAGDTLSRGVSSDQMGNGLKLVDLGGLPIRDVARGGSAIHSCVLLLNHEVKCWGAGYSGALGYGNNDSLGSDPSQLGDGLPYVRIW